MNDVIIVGGGPAGVSCAIWLKQLGFSPILVEKADKCGGLQWSNAYTNTWIATSSNVHGPDVAQAMHDNILAHSIPTKLGQEAIQAHILPYGVNVVLRNNEIVKGQFLVLAAGVTPNDGGLTKRVGLLIGSGPAIATQNFTGQHIAILGGGDSAFENYGFVMSRGAAKVTIFARSLKARSEMLARVPAENVVIGDYVIDDDANVINGEHFNQILVMYGYKASKSSLLGLDLILRNDGFVWTNEDCQSSIERVYAIGEIARRAHPCCVTSMADGVTAAKAIQRQLETTTRSKYLGMAKRMISLGTKGLS